MSRAAAFQGLTRLIVDQCLLLFFNLFQKIKHHLIESLRGFKRQGMGGIFQDDQFGIGNIGDQFLR